MWLLGYREKERESGNRQWEGSDQSPKSSFIEKENYVTNMTNLRADVFGFGYCVPFSFSLQSVTELKNDSSGLKSFLGQPIS